MATFTQSFPFTGADQTFTVPAGVNSINIKTWGAGGGGSQAPGGAGGYASGTLPVTQGDVLTIITGQGGGTGLERSYGGGGAGGTSTGPRGSNGAGRSAVRKNGTEVITAGGGGSSGSRNLPQYSDGGSGGCTTGVNAFNSGDYAPGSVPAQGGTQGAGGAGGVNPYNGAFNGGPGSAFQGGDGGFGTTLGSGAGGGGGYFGGGGGAGELATAAPLATDAAGAGGSSYIGGVTSGLTLCTPQNTSPNVGNPQFPPNTTDPNYVAGVGVGNSSRGVGAGGNGLVVITFDIVPDPIPIIKKVSKTAAKVGDVLTYTLTIPNNGLYPASNVVITDPIPAGTSYVPGSTSSSVPFTGDPTSTINLTNPIAVGETVTVTYQVTVDTLPTPNPIPNTAVMDYSITPVVGAPPIDVTATSNTVTTLVFEPSRGVPFI